MSQSSTTNSSKNSISRYVKGGVTYVSTSGMLGWWERGVFASDPSDTAYTIAPDEAGRADLISFRVYGSVIYDWLILQYNNIVDLNEELQTGSTIMLPSKKRVLIQF